MPIGPAIRHMGIPSTTLLGQDAVENSSSVRIHSAPDVHNNPCPTKRGLPHNGVCNEQRSHQGRTGEHGKSQRPSMFIVCLGHSHCRRKISRGFCHFQNIQQRTRIYLQVSQGIANGKRLDDVDKLLEAAHSWEL